jgi:hypothetical protein
MTWIAPDARRVEPPYVAGERIRLDAWLLVRHMDETVTVDLRWLYVHMIDEYARHNGHADLLRELVDGTTGLLPGCSYPIFMRAAMPSSRAARPRSNWLSRVASVIGGPGGSVSWRATLSV